MEQTKINNETEQQTSTATDLSDTNARDRQLSSAIFLSLELENNFKLMSYRIITQQQFIDKVNESIEIYKNLKK